ncbi:MAG: translation elongation factor 4 [Candidatus Hydrogenedentota bacterium]
MNNIRNFAIIAHIDHGKSTLSDRLIEKAGLLQKKEKIELIMDDMEIERERGITIKANTARLKYNFRNEEYILNLIDTPGHVDFSYEVIRSLGATEGVILLVDATQGVEAQTIANLYLAMDTGKIVIPVINKIDVKNINLDRIRNQIIDLGFSKDEILYISAKTGEGIDSVFCSIIERIPPPSGSTDAPFKALVFDAKYDDYVAGVIYIRVFDGKIKQKMKVKFYSGEKVYEVQEIGYLTPERAPSDKLTAGEVGYCIAGFKSLREIKIGDTLYNVSVPEIKPVPGYKELKPMVFCGMYPVRGTDFEELKKALLKLHLNDTSFEFSQETSNALGFGYRCGFLGLLHMEIIQERLEREFNLDLIVTAPNVKYKVVMKNNETAYCENPSKFPDTAMIDYVEEPYLDLKIVSPSFYVGSILDILNDRRAIQKEMIYLDCEKVMLEYEMPLTEMIFDFYDKLKSISRGYASMDYSNLHYKKSDMVKINILVNDEPVDALSVIVHKTKAYRYGKNLVKKLKEVIPRHLFTIPIQAATGSRVIARENISALRKNVTAKCYGGDVTRKRKLLERQKEGKKRMKKIGKVEIPQQGFLAVLRANEPE